MRAPLPSPPPESTRRPLWPLRAEEVVRLHPPVAGAAPAAEVVALVRAFAERGVVSETSLVAEFLTRARFGR